jgi:hypothetical protein
MKIKVTPLNDVGRQMIEQITARGPSLLERMYGDVTKDETGAVIEVKLPRRFFSALASMNKELAKSQISNSLLKSYREKYGVMPTDIKLEVLL